jgi:hypothetical protein
MTEDEDDLSEEDLPHEEPRRFFTSHAIEWP